MKQLKIYKSLYINKDAAREWYMNIAKSIHPDICNSEKISRGYGRINKHL